MAFDLQQRVDHFMADQPEEMGQTAALLVQRHGETVAEAYDTTNGMDENSQLLSWSMAKSITHALVGILVGEGRLVLDDPAPVAEWSTAGDPRGAITLDQLLRMHPGLQFVEDYVDDQVSDCLEMLFGAGKADMGAYAANQELVHEPGTTLNYSSGTTNIITRLLADIVGRGPDFETWMRQVLLDPIGIGPAQLTFDDAGTWVGSSYLHTSARDFAAFGNLYLNDGVASDGTRVLPEGWVDHGWSPTAVEAEGRLYLAHWWRFDEDRMINAALGYDAQRILVQPSSGTVVVRLGKTPVELAPNLDTWLLSLFDDPDTSP